MIQYTGRLHPVQTYSWEGEYGDAIYVGAYIQDIDWWGVCGYFIAGVWPSFFDLSFSCQGTAEYVPPSYENFFTRGGLLKGDISYTLNATNNDYWGRWYWIEGGTTSGPNGDLCPDLFNNLSWFDDPHLRTIRVVGNAGDTTNISGVELLEAEQYNYCYIVFAVMWQPWVEYRFALNETFNVPSGDGSIGYYSLDVGVASHNTLEGYFLPGQPATIVGTSSWNVQAIEITYAPGRETGLPPPAPPGEPPVASFTYSPEKPMVGGVITFDASSSQDPDGTIASYEWDFGDGETASGIAVSHVFQNPSIYTVTLTVTDNDGLTGTVSKGLNLSLRPGDLLLCRSPDSWVPGFWTHVGMYIGNNEVVEALPSGVVRRPLFFWNYPWKTCVEALSVETADDQTRANAVLFALGKVGAAYDWNLTQKSVAGDTWYCSELVWAAYRIASLFQINIEHGPDDWGITPQEIHLDNDTRVIGEHREEVPRGGFLVISTCPVDLSVIDPDGSLISKGLNEVAGVAYGEDDIDNDGDVDDWVGISSAKEGDYLISVIPEPTARPTDTFTLVVNRNGTDRVLAQDVQVRDILPAPYVVTGISNISVDVQAKPETLNLSRNGNSITCYLHFPKVCYAYNVNRNTILLNGVVRATWLGVDEEVTDEGVAIVKFSWAEVKKILAPGQVELSVAGELLDGTQFTGTDTIRVTDKGKYQKKGSGAFSGNTKLTPVRRCLIKQTRPDGKEHEVLTQIDYFILPLLRGSPSTALRTASVPFVV